MKSKSESNLWYCKDCMLDSDIPNDTESIRERDDDLFKYVVKKHESCDGWQIAHSESKLQQSDESEKRPEKTINELGRDATNKCADELREELDLKKQLRQGDVLRDIVTYLGKEIKKEENNIYRVLLNGLSAFTKNPNNSRILAPSSEGKTYLSSKISALFPQQNVVQLASASAQSFKYQTTDLVRITEDDLQSINEEMKKLKVQLAETKDKKTESEIKQKIRELREESFGLVEFENKWIVFSDSQNHALWESLKTLLSHDAPYIKHQVTNKVNGQNIQQKIIFKGHPAMLYCSAKDEEESDKTREIESRFDTISLQTNPEKYREGIKLISNRHGLSGDLFAEEIVSKSDTILAKKRVQILIDNVQVFGNNSNPVLNPFSTKLSEIFPHDTAIRQRQFDRFMQMISIITLCYAHQRCKVQYGRKTHPITTLSDIKLATEIMKEPPDIQLHKIQFLNDIFKGTVQEVINNERKQNKEQKTLSDKKLSEVWVTALQVSYYAQSKTKDKSLHRQKVQETLLKPLFFHGYLESKRDPDNNSRYVYRISPKYDNKDVDLESTLIDTSTLDGLCLRVFIEKYLKQRNDSGKLRILDEKNNEISLEYLPKMLMHFVTQTPKFVPRNDSVEASKSIEVKNENLTNESAQTALSQNNKSAEIV